MTTLSARTSPTLHPTGRHVLARLGALLGTLFLAGSPLAAQLSSLEKNVPQARELTGGEAREHRLAAQAGDYVRVTVSQTGADVAVRLLAPSGAEIMAADGVGGRKEPELLSWIARESGDFRLAVTPHEAGGTGRYEVVLEELRPAGAGDEDRVEAERASSEGSHWWTRQDEESRRKALAAFTRAAPLWRSAGDRIKETDSLNQIGICHQRLGNTDTAVATYEKALALAQEIGYRMGEAEARNNLAIIYDVQFKDPRALSYYESALAIYEAEGKLNEVSSTLCNLGLYWNQRGEFGRAIDVFNRALELKRSLGERVGEARVLAGLAMARRAEEPKVALELFGQALERLEGEEDIQAEAHVTHGMASTYLLQGELQKAIELFTRALDLFQVLGAQIYEGMVLNSLGTTALYLGNLDEAKKRYDQALEIHRKVKNPLWEAYTLRDIGWYHSLRGEPEIALQHYAQGLEISRAQKDETGQAAGLHGLGRNRLALKDPGQAAKDLEAAIAIYRKRTNFSEVGALLDLGRAWQALAEPEKAAESFRLALDFSRQRHSRITEAVAQAAMARLERDRGNLPAAASALEEALKIIESVRPKLASQRLRISFFASRREYYDLYVDLRMRMHERDPKAGHLAAAFAASEQGRGRALLDLLAEGRIDVRKGITPELKQRETEISSRVSSLQSQLLSDLSQGKGTRTAQIEAELVRAEEERERLEWQIRQEHHRYASVRSPSPLALDSIQELLDERTALLEFSVGQERSFLFVVTRGGVAGYPLPPAAELAELVETMRRGVQERGRRLFQSYADAASRLYEILIRPAEPLLGDRPNLIISPDGPLLQLSFEALLTAPPAGSGSAAGGYGSLPYLILDRSVSYVPSASILAELQEPRPASAETATSKLFLGFGAPDYGAASRAPENRPAGTPSAPAAPEGSLAQTFRDSGLLNPQPLPASREEVSRIAGLYPSDRVQLYLDGQASEANVKANPFLKDARLIHFAVHGFVNEKEPELSGLLLSLNGDPRENGLLQTYEIFNLELNADLVVLSACDTGLGKNVTGEGLIGVTRALLYAGAASVVVSLWQVGDTSTSDLMVRFYRHLNETGDRAEALRLSKLELIREGRFDHPNNWAPFILIGQPRSPVTPGALARQ